MRNRLFYKLISMLIVFASILTVFPAVSFAASFNEYNTDKEIPVLTLDSEGFGKFEFEDMWIKGFYKVYDDEPDKASGGKYIRPTASGTTTSDAQVVRDQVEGEDHVKLYIDVAEANYYTIWVRSKYVGNDGNYWVNLNGVTEMKHFSNAEDYTWNSVYTTRLTAGRHYIGFVPRRHNIMPTLCL